MTKTKMNSDPDLQAYTIAEVCKALKLSKRSVKAMLYRGEIRGFKMGNRWRISQGELRRLLGYDTVSPGATENVGT